MGELRVPGDALFGAQTARAVENFPISGQRLGRDMIRALGAIKRAAAEVNVKLGRLDARVAAAIAAAAREVAEHELDQHFPVDVFQTGSGTSSNMNANEVIANRANQRLGAPLGAKAPVHPNDHVNLGQSSNDVFPTAIHLAAVCSIRERLMPALTALHQALAAKASEFDEIVKIGRTHLQDATPIRLGQVFSGYAAQVEHGMRNLESAVPQLSELALGGTAVGTGLNTHREFGRRVAERLSDMTGHGFREAANHFQAQASQDAAVNASGALRTLAVSLMKIANDIRWLGSGPRLGLGELSIPPVQPGSSMMPGKVNPVIAESLIMVCAQVIGNDAAITLGGFYGNFELNTMLPLIARNLLEQIALLASGCRVFTDKLIVGLRANDAHITARNEQSLSLATALAPHIGYDAAAELAKDAHETGRTVRELARERQMLPETDLERVLDLRRQTEPDGDAVPREPAAGSDEPE
jgi:fumarate hydratase class II